MVHRQEDIHRSCQCLTVLGLLLQMSTREAMLMIEQTGYIAWHNIVVAIVLCSAGQTESPGKGLKMTFFSACTPER